MKKLLFCCFFGLIFGCSFSIFFDRQLDPGYLFFGKADDETQRWLAKLRAESDAPCYIFTGGSQVRMGSIYPKVMYDEYGVRAVNAGANAGYGLAANIAIALEYAKPGDYLLLAMRDIRHNESTFYTTSGNKFLFVRQGLTALKSPIMKRDTQMLLDIARSEASSVAMYIVYRAFFPEKLDSWNKYVIIHESGWCEQTYTKELQAKPMQGLPHHMIMAAESKHFLSLLKNICEQRQIKFCVFMNAHYTTEADIPYLAMTALRLTEAGIPVLKDPTFACEPDASNFTDSLNHLSIKGATKYSRIYANSIINNAYWTREELVEILRQHGLDENGYPLTQ